MVRCEHRGSKNGSYNIYGRITQKRERKLGCFLVCRGGVVVHRTVSWPSGHPNASPNENATSSRFPPFVLFRFCLFLFGAFHLRSFRKWSCFHSASPSLLCRIYGHPTVDRVGSEKHHPFTCVLLLMPSPPGNVFIGRLVLLQFLRNPEPSFVWAYTARARTKVIPGLSDQNLVFLFVLLSHRHGYRVTHGSSTLKKNVEINVSSKDKNETATNGSHTKTTETKQTSKETFKCIRAQK